MKKQRQKKNIWKNFFRFYTRFPIPWWLYILSMTCGLLSTYITLQLNSFTISFNKGELYNNVLLGYAAWTLISMAVNVALNMTAAYGSQKVTYRGRKVLWCKILCLPMSVFRKEKPYGMVASVTEELPNAAAALNVISTFCASMYGFIAAVIVLVQFNATMLTYMLVLLPLAVFQFWANGKLQYYMDKRKYSALNFMTAFFAEHLKCAKQVKANAMEQQEVEAGLDVIDAQFKADLLWGLLLSLQTLINAAYQTLYNVFIAVFGANLIGKGKMTSDGILTFKTYWTTQDKFLSEMLTQHQTIKGTQGAMEKVCRVLDEEEESSEQDPDVLYTPADIVLKNVSFGYTAESPVLENISCTIPYGRTVAVIGGNGSGKSTLLRLLLGLYQPDSGSIFLHGQENTTEDLHKWRSQFGYVSQSAPLFSGTIRENLQYGMAEPLTEEKISVLCDAANLHEVLTEKENGLNEQVGEAGNRLSGGQRQRVAIARAMANDPAYLLLDEATSQLDAVNDRKIERNVTGQMTGRSIIFIAHNMESARRADIIMLLSDGKLVDMGSDAELMERCELYQKMVRIQEGEVHLA